MSVLILAPSYDLHAHGVFDTLKRRGVAVSWVDLLSAATEVRVTAALNHVVDIQLTDARVQNLRLSEMRTIWWRQPGVPEVRGLADEATSAFVQGEWEGFYGGLECLVDTRWINSPTAYKLARYKAVQLQAARSEGLRIPHTTITNDAGVVRSIYDSGLPIVYKGLGGVRRPLTVTRALTQDDLNRVDSIGGCPAIFQERIEARCDIRVTVVGSDLYAAEIDSQSGSSSLDWRLDHTVDFQAHSLDTDVASSLRAVMRRLGLLHGAIDLRLTPEGEYVFLEVNPGGQYLFIELLAGIPITTRMAAFLAEDPEASLSG